ncbi:MAG TPA: carboxypeptidase-like regulatory domain-containing protein, partial [Mucilaginibacter sp.]|nr:carboxypeptidase-like regulatory domain-containing protein [Mucilaginibacter sp.]
MEFSTLYPQGITYQRLKKTILVMKLTILIIMTICLHISAATFSQNITLNEKNIAVEKVLNKIEKQCGYSFWYEVDFLKKMPKISLNVKDYSLENALDACFKNLPINYTIVRNTIVLKPKLSKDMPLGLQEQGVTQSKYADPIIITGKVTDNQNLPLSGVSVTVKGTKTGAITDANGQFRISIPDNTAVLVFSYVGYTTREMPYSGSKNITISLQPTLSSLNEVSVTSYGIEKKTSDLGYSVTTIKGDELDRTNTVNPITALQGKVAGVVINTTQVAGIQTSPFIQIRGANAIGGNNQPIFVIDGNILYNNIASPDGTDAGSQLKNLNPDDYESITVLKGAAATALYGSRGLNGAVVINTKSGKARSGLGVEYSSTYQFTNVYKNFMALQNQYGMGSYSREGNFKPDGSQSVTTSNWGPAFDGSIHPSTFNPTLMVPYVAQPDNWRTFYQTGKYRNNNITLSGGSENGTYRLSYSNRRADGLLPNNGLKTNAVDLKYTSKINKIFSTEMGVNYANTVTQNYYNQSRYSYSGGQNLGFDVYYLPRNTDFGLWHNTYRNADNSTKPDPFNGWITNAFTAMDKNNYYNHENSVLGYVLLKAQVTPTIDLSAQGNVNYYNNFTETKNYGNAAFNKGGYYGISGNSNTNYNLLLQAH